MTTEIKNLFEKYKMVSSINTVSLKEMLEEAFALGHEKALDSVEKEIDNLANYPKDIFVPLSNRELNKIHKYCLSLGFPIDRFSAHVCREIEDGIKKELKQRLEKLRGGEK